MRILAGLLGALLMTFPTEALESAGGKNVTMSFDMPGGYFKELNRRNFAPPTPESPPYEIRFVITGINLHDEWDSDIGFFFEPDTEKNKKPDTEGDKEKASSGDSKEEFRLRFWWSPRRAALVTSLNFMADNERNLMDIPIPVALNQAVTVSVKRRDADTLMLLINGEDIFTYFSDRLNRLTVHISGIKGELTLPPE